LPVINRSYRHGKLPTVLIALRLARVLVHVFAAFDAALAFGRLSETKRHDFVRWWARGLLAVLGVRLHVAGEAVRKPALIVANHVSWLDIIALLAVEPAQFVCKSEVAAWPVIGWLARRVGTIFIRRGSVRDVWRVNMELRARFASLQSVGAFPEGTTSMGDDVGPFRPALFQPAVERGLAVQPVAISYSSKAAAFVGDTSFLRSLLAICAAPTLEVHVALLPPLASGLTRKQAAAQAREAIRARISQEIFDLRALDLRPRGPYAAAASAWSTNPAMPGSASPPGPRVRPDS
jgi:1-acyl-sn-glycerol-3-phosphate acyltransferase